MMEGPIYPSQFEHFGIDLLTPQASDRARLNALLFEEMIYGKFTDEAREYVMELMREMKRQGCDAAGLCCTELPLLLGAEDSPSSSSLFYSGVGPRRYRSASTRAPNGCLRCPLGCRLGQG